MDDSDTRADGYHKGDGYKLTGKTVVKYGRAWLEGVFLEGRRKGEAELFVSAKDVAVDVARKQAEHAEQQAAFVRLARLSRRAVNG